MAHVSDFAAGRAGVVKNFHDTRLSTCEELVSPAVFRAADDFAVHSILSLRPRGDSQSVFLFSSLHAAPLGWHSAITRNLSQREKIGRVPPLVCQVVRAQALQMDKNFTIPAGISGGGHRHRCAVLGRARNGTFILGPIFDAPGFARYDAAHIAGLGCYRRRHELPKNGRESVWTRYAATEHRSEVFKEKDRS